MRTLLFVVDDNEVFLRSLRRTLNQADVTYVYATDLAEARSIWSEHAEDIALIAMDGILPDGLGTDFVREIRPHFSGQIASITDTSEMIPKMIEAGCDLHIAKGTSAQLLIAMMMRHLDSLPPSSSFTE
jgi:CheY-like chemotaxis protein